MNLAQLSNQELLERAHQLDETVALQQERIALLEQRLQLLLHKQYGRKSEQISSQQLSLLDESSVSDDSSASADETHTITVSYTKRRGKRKPLNAELERHQVHHHLPEDQAHCDCGASLKEIGTHSSEHYEYIPARVLVIEHIQHQYACPCCEGKLVLAKKPASIFRMR